MSPARALTALALAIGLAHLPFLASSLEDIDSVNFALGVRDFDVAAHRPHPPGYPVYIAIGKAVTGVLGWWPGAAPESHTEARALSWVSLAAALASVLLLYRVFASLRRWRDDQSPWSTLDLPALAATTLTLASPLAWTLAVRPMSDLPGFALALGANACLLAAWWWQTPKADGDRRMTPDMLAASGRLIVLGALVAGVAVGLRTQTLWLTAPVLVMVLVDRIGRGFAGALIGSAMTFTIGALAWGIPLLLASGGLQAYLAALGTQAGEDFAGGEMLYLNPAPRLVAMALVHTFVDPWESGPLGVAVLALGAIGAIRLLVKDRRSLAMMAAMAVPYSAFHLLLQDTSFTRYALPLVPVVAFLAVQGALLLPPKAAWPAVAALTAWAFGLGAPMLVEYAAEAAPTVRVVSALNTAAASSPPAALAMHQTFRRPLDAEDVTISPQLASPPRREWLELARYWREGGTGVVWFLADPRRTDLSLVDPQARRDGVEVRWGPASRRVFGGLRPAAVDWVRLQPPRWFAEDGWALTPETAGMARLMGRGPHLEPIVARVRRDASATRVLVGGRNLAGSGDPAARFTLAIDGRGIETWDVPPGFFVRTVDLPAGTLEGPGPWASLTLQSRPVSGEAPLPTAIEQFDLQRPDTIMWAYDAGWHEAEYSPALGVWHWTSDRATLRVVGATSGIRITLDCEPPLRYFDVPSAVGARAGDVELSQSSLGAAAQWSFDVPLDALVRSDGLVSIETSQVFVPAERGSAPDRRALGLRVFRIRVEPVGLR